MRLTRGSDYGAHAVIELASCYGQGPLQCAEIAARQKIPEAYLDQLLSILRRVGIVRSVRGPHGGHELARDPRQVTLGEVVTALEGPVVPHEFVHTPEGGENPDWGSACAVRNAWHAAATASQRVLDSITIQELVEQQVLIRSHRQEQPEPVMGIRSAAKTLVTTD
ncbi:MAG TPA: Rrf2 family transcriptional regulator [Chloroflexota bacterium]|jgi:Rrf2 family protein|nr:Rrf2 family transcriptional regulator [Chloroflexota bacterium]